MQTTQTTSRESELRVIACKLSLKELNDLVDECLDRGDLEDASIYAKIYNRRIGRSK